MKDEYIKYDDTEDQKLKIIRKYFYQSENHKREVIPLSVEEIGKRY